MPSDALTRLDVLLSDPAFWEDELFIEAEEAARALDTADWAVLQLEVRGKQVTWWEHLMASLSEVTDSGAVTMSMDLLSDPDPSTVKQGQAMLDGLAAGAGDHLGDEELLILAIAWRKHPELREAIKQTAWGKGKSGRLRRLLELERWCDAH